MLYFKYLNLLSIYTDWHGQGWKLDLNLSYITNATGPIDPNMTPMFCVNRVWVDCTLDGPARSAMASPSKRTPAYKVSYSGHPAVPVANGKVYPMNPRNGIHLVRDWQGPNPTSKFNKESVHFTSKPHSTSLMNLAGAFWKDALNIVLQFTYQCLRTSSCLQILVHSTLTHLFLSRWLVSHQYY